MWTALAALPCRGRPWIVDGFLQGIVLSRTPRESGARLGSSRLVQVGASTPGKRYACGEPAASHGGPRLLLYLDWRNADSVLC